MPNLKSAGLKAINQPVLVTGHTGFKGVWLTLLLEALGIAWIGISLDPKPDSLYQLLNSKTNKRDEFFIDIRDYQLLKQIIYQIKPSYVVHLAAQSLVLDSYNTPRETFETNVLGTANLLDSMAKCSSNSRVVIVTTDKVYKEKKSSKSFIESDPFGGKDPYSWSKVGTESVIGAWQQISKVKNGSKIISVRSGNVVGGGDKSENRLLPDLIKGFLENSIVKVRNPESTRPWQHVLDPLYGYLLALTDDSSADVFNFSPGSKSLTVRNVAKIAAKEWGGSTQLEFSTERDNFETRSLSLNSKKAQKILKWRSHWTQEESIMATVSWWKNVNNQSLTPRQACLRDIGELLHGS